MTLMHAPGNTDDLDDQRQVMWTDTLSAAFSDQVRMTRTIPNPEAARAWFFDAAGDGLDQTVTKDIFWTAFPKKMKQANWLAVDQERNLQEEYCEWEVARKEGKVVRVTFTTETPDYYQFLWERAPKKVLELYNKFVSPQVQLADLASGGRYNPQNRWNWPAQARGALMHMGQINNTLGAAMNLSAQACWPILTAAGVPIVSEQELIAAIPFGDAGRHSDPHIGAQINELVRDGNEVSFADPVGLYIDEVDLIDFETPDGSSARKLMRVTRGSDEFMLRVVFEAPAGANFVLGDVMIGGRKINFGSQIAEKIKVRIRGAARKTDQRAPQLKLPDFSVVGQPAPVAAKPPLKPGDVRGLGRVLEVRSMLSPE